MQHVVHRGPARFDAVGALEQRLVAEHAVVQQRLIADVRAFGEEVGVVERRLHRADLHHRTRRFHVEVEARAVRGIDAQGQHVRRERVDGRVAEQPERHRLQLHRDLRATRGQPLAGAQIERHAGPAPVLDEHACRRVGFRRAVRARRSVPRDNRCPPDLFRTDRTRRRRRVSGWIASKISAFLSRTASASNELGGSIATMPSNWNRWFGSMSRNAPVCS